MWACAAAMAGALIVGLPVRASADAIGIFSFNVDPVWGPIFTVENDSADPFTDVTIDLFSGTQGDGDLVKPLSLLEFGLPDLVDAGGIWQTFDDLTGDTFGSAVLTFLYAPAGSTPIVVAPLEVGCDAETGCSAPLPPPPGLLIDFTANQGGSGGGSGGGTQVPEPPTWALLGVGLAAMTIAARGRGFVRTG